MKLPPAGLGAFNLASIATCILLLVPPVWSLTFDLTRVQNSVPLSRLRRQTEADGRNLRNVDNILYYTQIKLNEALFNVAVDTGSSDLMIAGNVPGAQNTGVTVAVPNSDSSVNAAVQAADMTLQQYSVIGQAYVSAPADPVTNAPGVSGMGIIGFGPSPGSQILDSFQRSPLGDPPLDRIFRQNPAVPNYITLFLQRSSLFADPFFVREDGPPTPGGPGGRLTIGEVAEGFENVVNQPKVPILTGKMQSQHWQALLDSNGIIGPNGQRIETKSIVNQSDPSRLNVIFDTGKSFSSVPKNVADALYAGIPGSKYLPADSEGNPPRYLFPCTYELNASFVFEGVVQPIHPLDLSYTDPNDPSGKNCLSTFREIDPNFATSMGYDAILGDSFLRNVYILINFGNFVDGSPEGVADPFVRLLPITNPEQAHKEFVQARLGGVDTTGSQPPFWNVASPAPYDSYNASSSAINRNRRNRTKAQRRRNAIVAGIIVGVIAVFLLLCGLLKLFILRRTRNRQQAYRPLVTPYTSAFQQPTINPPEPVTQGVGYREAKDEYL